VFASAASDTPPVREVLNKENGLPVPFFDIEQLAERVIEALAHPRQFRSIRTQARRTVLDQYDLARICLAKMMAFIQKAREMRATCGAAVPPHNYPAVFLPLQYRILQSRANAAHHPANDGTERVAGSRQATIMTNDGATRKSFAA
jgi:hypothetical protein